MSRNAELRLGNKYWSDGRSRSRRAQTPEPDTVMASLSILGTEDSWEEGEIGSPQQVFDEKLGEFSSVQEAIEEAANVVAADARDLEFEAYDDGRLSTVVTVDEDVNFRGDDDRFMERFKAGEVRAWTADIDLSVKFAATWVPSGKTLDQYV